MSETLRLLKYPPSVALLIMANNHFNLMLRPEYARVSGLTALTENQTQVVIEAFDSKNDFLPSPYTGSFTYRYRRLDVAEVFGELRLNLTPPLTVEGIVNNIALQTGIAIDKDDFENALIETDTFTLVAKAESLRWVGQTTVVLNTPGEVISLADAFPNNILDGLVGPDYGTDIALSLVVLNTTLSGLQLPPPSIIELSSVVAQQTLTGLNIPDHPHLSSVIVQTSLPGFEPEE